MRYLAVGDIHGNFRALEQVLRRAAFDPQADTLIGLGDYVDRQAQSAEVVEYLISLPHFTGVLGNHDVWCREWLRNGSTDASWLAQGGEATVQSYKLMQHAGDARHLAFFEKLHPCLVLDLHHATYAFVHGGWESEKGLGQEKENTLLSGREAYLWDRLLWSYAGLTGTTDYSQRRTAMYDRVFIGHTPTPHFKSTDDPARFLPEQRLNIWNLDQGAGWDGRLTVMNIETEDYWQSDRVGELYGAKR